MQDEYIPKEILKIRFEIIEKEEIKRVSVLGLTSRDLYTSEGKLPAPSGPLDLRLGPSTKNSLCSTCGEKISECMGHFGHIELPLPVFHPGLLKNAHKILQSICKTCGSILIPEEQVAVLLTRIRAKESSRPGIQKIVKKVHEEAKKRTECCVCKAINGTVRKNGFKFFHRVHRLKKHDTQKEEEKERYKHVVEENSEIQQWVDGVPDEYISPSRALELFRKMEVGSRELFGMSCSPEALMITCLPVLPGPVRPSVLSIDSSSNEDDLTIKLSEISYTSQLIQSEIEKGSTIYGIMENWDLLQSQCAQLITSDNKIGTAKIRSLVQRLKGKHGRFRGNLSGKRVEFSGRTVISPDPNLSIEEVGIPVEMAKTLTVPVKITESNMAAMEVLSRKGCDKHPGANYLIREERRIFLRSNNKIELLPGDVLERHMADGDVVLFNRQPSLHRLSIMAHKTKILPGRTLRFNECVCSPYNADFDGDEMNIHLAQNTEARVEALELMGVKNNLVVPRNGQPLVAATQDFITGAYLITDKDVFFNREEIGQLLAYAHPFGKRIKVHSTILRPKVLYTGKMLLTCTLNLTLSAEIRTREYTKTPKYIGEDGVFITKNGEILAGRMDKRVIGGEEGSILHHQLLETGPDIVVKALDALARLCSRYLGERGFSIGLDDLFAQGALEESINAAVSKCEVEAMNCSEDRTISVLSRAREDAGAICAEVLGKKNSPVVMQACGSKGSLINVSQMVACVGQQIVRGQRISLEFGSRSLPHFEENSSFHGARGFVRSSFCSGLTPTEFFFHAVSGREGLVDTAVKTAETGYMQRRLMKVLEGVHVAYDGTVRRGKQLIQMHYGEDGLDPSLLQKGSLFSVMPSALEWARDPERKEEEVDKRLFGILKKHSDRIIGKERAEIEIIEGVNKGFGYEIFNVSNEETIRKILDFLIGSKKPKEKKETILLFISRMLSKIIRSKMEYGTAAGALAAQSIGEPGTQMTLKTFHLAGTSGANITLGVPRLKEIINAATNISTPIITIDIIDQKTEKDVQERIRALSIRNLAVSVSIGKCTAIFLLSGDLIRKYSIEKEVRGIGAIKKDKDYEWEAPIDKGTPLEIEKHLNMHLRGVSSVKRILSTSDGLMAEGEGYQAILGIEGVDSTRTRTNNIYEIYQTLGIEAAREAIIREIKYIIGEHGISVDTRHISLLTDVMCYTGEICGMTRFGLQKMGGSSVLTLASFEQTGEHLFSAGYHGHEDPIEGVSECIITGQRIPIGTGIFNIRYDPSTS
ncbi:DNA-directed RNA polymerase III subunit RPC1 [Nematocida sp. LUAm3]|nr:DNA-directed RNA polymerase III subunit RPC1 [Nematocida sp. LUAm3]KAI5175666.1 DNA-directed RNA polymerase III subunit RPC1 [Nematocida sp. LUAm2]KAI5178572.1 DNA-directed RNA polymerase III subunit RPC1 [Nematocida sp. LUAm1]